MDLSLLRMAGECVCRCRRTVSDVTVDKNWHSGMFVSDLTASVFFARQLSVDYSRP